MGNKGFIDIVEFSKLCKSCSQVPIYAITDTYRDITSRYEIVDEIGIRTLE